MGAKKCHLIKNLLTSTARLKRINARKNNTCNNYLLTQSEVMPAPGGGRCAAGARERRGACRGEILTRTQINAQSNIKTFRGN